MIIEQNSELVFSLPEIMQNSMSWKLNPALSIGTWHMPKSKNSKKSDGDDQLTNLSWLQGIDISMTTRHAAPARVAPKSHSNNESDKLAHFPNYVRNAQQKSLQSKQRALLLRQNPEIKPPYSYSTMICMAMRESPSGRVTLSDIYAWIMENFAHYRQHDTTWQNSVRHNLSLNKCFEKLQRQKSDVGKGNYWRINPASAHLLEDGIIKRRRKNQNLVTPMQTTFSSAIAWSELKHEPDTPPMTSSSSSSCDSSGGSSYAGSAETTPQKQKKMKRTKSVSEPSVHAKKLKPSDYGHSLSLDNTMDRIFGDLDENGFDKVLASTLCDVAGEFDLDDFPLIEDKSLDDDPTASNSLPVDFLDGCPLNLSVTGRSLLPPSDWLQDFGGDKLFSTPLPSPRRSDTPPLTSQLNETAANLLDFINEVNLDNF